MKPEIIYGIHPVGEALAARRRRFFEVYVARRNKLPRTERILAQLIKAKVPVSEVSSVQLERITETDTHQGIGASVSPYPTVPLELLCKPANDKTGTLLLMLDNVVDPRNLGAVIRTGLCAGANGVIIPKNRSAMPTPLVSKASAGALEHMLLARVTNLVDAINRLKRKGIWVAGLEKDAGSSLYECDLVGDLLLVIGGEEKGIRPLVRKNCDFLISIPQREKINSLNASVAAGIVMYEAYRQRIKKDQDRL